MPFDLNYALTLVVLVCMLAIVSQKDAAGEIAIKLIDFFRGSLKLENKDSDEDLESSGD